MDDLPVASDVITLHLPLNSNTRHFIDSLKIAEMKKGAVLINTSRGAVVDTVALYDALLVGDISYAALDVLEYEDSLGLEYELDLEKASPEELRKIEVEKINRELVKMDNVIVTPHNAFNTREAIERIWKITAENIKAFSEGRTQNEVVYK